VRLQLGRETRGPIVVPASDGAIEDLDLHRESVADALDAGQLLGDDESQTGLSAWAVGFAS
jgi:hypothetical protein